MPTRIRNYIFLRDVLTLALTTFGGPQAHLAHFHNVLVERRKWITEEELLEINSLCQILPGPASTQTLTAVGFKIGGPNLAYLTLLVWILPAVVAMTAAAVIMSSIQTKNLSLDFTRFIQPIAVGFVSYGAYSISLKTVSSKTGIAIMMMAGLVSYFIQTHLFPSIACGGISSAEI